MSQMKGWKTRVMEGAAQFVRSDEFQRAYGWAKNTTHKVRSNLKEAKQAFTEQLQMGSDDDLKELKQKLVRLEEKDKRKAQMSTEADSEPSSAK